MICIRVTILSYFGELPFSAALMAFALYLVNAAFSLQYMHNSNTNI